MLRNAAIGALSLAAAACSGDSSEGALAIPLTGTDYVVWATAAAGRAVQPGAVHVARATDVTSLKPDTIGGSDVDMFFAGMKKEDLPAGLEPTDLSFVPENDENARKLPPLYAAHVLADPSAPGRGTKLVPAEDSTAGGSVSAERKERLRVMTLGLSVRDPCSDPLTPIVITAPHTPGEDFRAFRTLSSGETFIGTTATSTAILDAIQPNSMDPEFIGVGTGTVAVRMGDRTRISDLGDSEAHDATGRVVPGELPINFIGAFGGLGAAVRFDESAKKYVDDTPIDHEAEARGIAPGVLAGVRHVSLEGTPSLCGYGGARGPNRIAAIWCRTTTSTTWTLSGSFREAYAITSILERDPPLSPIAFDVTGTIYTHESRGWAPLTTAAVNDGCMPPCVVFGEPAVRQTAAGFSMVLGGTHATALIAASDENGDVAIASLDAVNSALFSDERMGSDTPIHFASATFSPDGAVWLGTQEQILIRVNPELSEAKRICLPKDARGTETVAIHAHPQGRLYLGMTPGLLGFADWRQ